MKRFKGFMVLLFGTMLLTTMLGCSGAFWGGTGAGVMGTGAGYELRAEQQMNKITEELKSGKITQQEYDIRKDQIQKGSILK